ncbi:AAA family ATPase [Psychrobacter sp. Ps6]|uniref:AAA family ATPase n=1 Tax=Psychrobacter sp. Ps6 TaxID=2790960 RepID=UPI001EDEC6DB|nr:AAA family ATPase [Psychrobacter sp. Ps6]MCG3880104.1 AAA family ATPase [Psychrobacter sp. Ps6]
MARKNRKNNHVKSEIPSPSANKEVTKISELLKSVTGSIVDKEQEMLLEKDSELREKMLADLESYTAAEQQYKQDSAEYQSKNTLLNEEIEALEQQKSDLYRQKTKLDEDNASIAQGQTELDKARQQLLEEKKGLKKEQLELQKQLSVLEEQQINAELGFASQKQEALQVKNKELSELQKTSLAQIEQRLKDIYNKDVQLSEREQQIVLKEEELTIRANNLEQDLLKALHARKENDNKALQKQKLDLVEQESALKLAQTELEETKAQLDIQNNVLKSHIHRKFEAKITQLTAENKALIESKAKAINEIDRMAQENAQFEDLKRQLNNDGINNVQEELNRLRQKNRELKHELSERYEDGLIEDNERLEERLDDTLSQLEDLKARYAEAQSELNNTRLSALERQNLLQEKRILEEHKRVLNISIEQLKSQIDDLEDAQKGALPFALLSDMDEKFSNLASGLQAVPSLEEFSNLMRARIANQGLYYTNKDIRLFIAGLSMSKLHILQGISGTGKTSLARAFAKAINNPPDNDNELYCEVIRVQAGWRDREDLLGHYNAFEKKFYAKEALQALYRAQQPRFQNTLQIILLDEMNLSQPEQYFADFLSLLETSDIAKINLLDSSHHDAPLLFKNGRTLEIPKNVWFIGTANHDETTKEFADKTYDRAHVMEIHRSEKLTFDNTVDNTQYSYSSLIERFEQAITKYQSDVDDIFELLLESELQKNLLKIKVSWGNRLQNQARKFIPVYMACGGTMAEALDHLLATKVFRIGKVCGRYDTRSDKIEDINDSLLRIWETLDLSGVPEESSYLLEQDIERLNGV